LCSFAAPGRKKLSTRRFSSARRYVPQWLWHAQIVAGRRRASRLYAVAERGIALQPNNQAAHCDEVMGKTAPNCRT